MSGEAMKVAVTVDGTTMTDAAVGAADTMPNEGPTLLAKPQARTRTNNNVIDVSVTPSIAQPVQTLVCSHIKVYEPQKCAWVDRPSVSVPTPTG